MLPTVKLRHYYNWCLIAQKYKWIWTLPVYTYINVLVHIHVFLLSESFGGEQHLIYSKHCAFKREKYVPNYFLVLLSHLFIFF